MCVSIGDQLCNVSKSVMSISNALQVFFSLTDSKFKILRGTQKNFTFVCRKGGPLWSQCRNRAFGGKRSKAFRYKLVVCSLSLQVGNATSHKKIARQSNMRTLRQKHGIILITRIQVDYYNVNSHDVLLLDLLLGFIDTESVTPKF